MEKRIKVMHRLFGTIAVGLLAISATACSVDASPDGSSDEQVGEAKQKSIENPTFPSGSSGSNWIWSSYSSGGTGADYVTMSNTLNQYWWVEGIGSWPSFNGLAATTANINACQANYINFYSSYYCSQWYNWAGTNGEQTVNATAFHSGGTITSCEASASAGTTYFSCATEWSTSTFTSPTGNVYTYAIANPL
jgi:hypothetical protein